MAPEFKKDKHGIPDPLHFELPHTHKKILELIYVIAIIGAIVSVLIYGSLVGWPSSVVNSTAMVVLILAVMLGIMVIEKSTITKKPKK